MIHPDIVRKLRNTREWAAVEIHIKGAIEQLDRLPRMINDDRAIAIEVVARTRAVETLKDILEPFDMFQDKDDAQELAQERAEDAGL